MPLYSANKKYLKKLNLYDLYIENRNNLINIYNFNEKNHMIKISFQIRIFQVVYSQPISEEMYKDKNK